MESLEARRRRLLRFRLARLLARIGQQACEIGPQREAEPCTVPRYYPCYLNAPNDPPHCPPRIA